MSKRGPYTSTLKRIETMREIAQQHYEPGNQSKCYAAIWRTRIYPVYGICYRTFLSYINTPPPAGDAPKQQLSLFD